MNTHYEGINNVWNKNRNGKEGWDVIKIYINIYAFIFTVKTFHTKPDDGLIRRKKSLYIKIENVQLSYVFLWCVE